jgi:hypothetical protein
LRAKNERDLRKLNERKKWTKGVLVGFYIAFLPMKSPMDY